MEEKVSGLTYFDMAENDYRYLEYDYRHHRVGNVFCYVSQNICERYLKHIIDVYVPDMDTSTALRTHSLRSLRNFMSRHIPDFQADWNRVLLADGFYFSTRYPGNDAFLAGETDVRDAWDAVLATREAVLAYCRTHSLSGRPEDTAAYLDGLRESLEEEPELD